MNQVISVGPQESFLVAICVLFLGQFVNAKLPILKKFNIPEPIGDSGGLRVLRNVPRDGQQLRCSSHRKWSLWLWSGRNPNRSHEHGLYL